MSTTNQADNANASAPPQPAPTTQENASLTVNTSSTLSVPQRQAPLTPVKPSSRMRQRSKTPKRPQTAFKPSYRVSQGSSGQDQIKVASFEDIKSNLMKMNYDIGAASKLESLKKEEILKIFLFLLTRIDEKYLFDIDALDFNRSFLTIKRHFRELNLPTSLSKQSLVGSFRTPVLYYFSHLFKKLDQRHGGMDALYAKEFEPFDQQLAKLKKQGTGGSNHGSVSTSLSGSSGASGTVRDKTLLRSARTHRSRRQSVPTQSFFNRAQGKTPQAKQGRMRSQQIGISKNKENISGNLSIDLSRTSGKTKIGMQSKGATTKSTDVAVTRALNANTPNVTHASGSAPKRRIRRTRASLGGTLSSAKPGHTPYAKSHANSSKVASAANNGIKTPRASVEMGTKRRHSQVYGAANLQDEEQNEDVDMDGKNAQMSAKDTAQNAAPSSANAAPVDATKTSQTEENTQNTGNKMKSAESATQRMEGQDGSKQEMPNEVSEDEDIDMFANKKDADATTGPCKDEMGHVGAVAPVEVGNGAEGPKNGAKMDGMECDNSEKAVVAGKDAIKKQTSANGANGANASVRAGGAQHMGGMRSEHGGGKKRQQSHLARMGKIASLETKLAQYTKENTRLETELKQQKMIVMRKNHDFDKQRRELAALRETNKSQRNQIESTKMVQKLIEEKNETIKLIAAQQAEQAKEMQTMRQRIEELTFEKEKERTEKQQLKSELERLQRQTSQSNSSSEANMSRNLNASVAARTPSPAPKFLADTENDIENKMDSENINDNEIEMKEMKEQQHESSDVVIKDAPGISTPVPPQRPLAMDTENDASAANASDAANGFNVSNTSNAANTAQNAIKTNVDAGQKSASKRAVKTPLATARTSQLARPKSSIRRNGANRSNAAGASQKVCKIGNKNFESYIRGKKLNELRLVDLRLYLKANRLSLYGTKDEVVARIEDHYYDRLKV